MSCTFRASSRKTRSKFIIIEDVTGNESNIGLKDKNGIKLPYPQITYNIKIIANKYKTPEYNITK